MARDIEEFLRKAADRRRQAQQRAAGQAPPPQRPPDLVIEDEVVEAAPVRKRLANNQESSAEFSERASHLGEVIEMAHEKRERELAKFDHNVSTLTKSSVTDDLGIPQTNQSQGAGGGNIAGEIARMFQTPSSMRQAIILSEVLTRPEHRW